MKRKTHASPAQSGLAMSTKSRRRSALTALLAAAIALLLVLPSLASAEPLGSVSLYNSGLRSQAAVFNMTAGPEGNAWFVDSSNFAGTPALGKINPEGKIEEYVPGTNLSGLNAGSNPVALTAGPEGKLWFTDRGATPAIGILDPGSPETIEKECPILGSGGNAESVPQGIVAGPDGNLWFADNGKTKAIGKVDPTAFMSNCEGSMQEFALSGAQEAEGQPQGIVAGPDGNLWFTDQGTGSAKKEIGKINPSTHAIEEFETGVGSVPGGNTNNPFGPWGIAAGADGNVWYTEGKEGARAICRITPAGSHTCFSTGLAPTSKPSGLTAGPEGKLWFSDTSGITEAQTITFSGATAEQPFEVCNEAKSKCATFNYKLATNGTSRGELKTRLTETYATVYGAGNALPSVSGNCGGNCAVSVQFAGELVSTNVGQTSCAPVSGTGTCSTGTTTQGVPNAIGSISTAGTIHRYTVDGQAGVNPIVSVKPGYVWFSSGALALAKIGKFGTEGPTKTLTVSKTGTGSGTVTSSPVGINCGGTCSSAFDEGEEVELSAKGTKGSVFASWSGACSGSGVCKVTMSSAKEVTAEFEPGPVLTLNAEEGSGTVVSNPAGLECSVMSPESCDGTFKTGTKVLLTASPAPGYAFKSWKGCDSGGAVGRQCTVTLSTAKTVGVKFNKVWNLAMTKSNGNGIASTSPGGVNCGYGCLSSAADYKEGALTLKAKPAKNFHFVEFKGGTGAAASCNGVTAETCEIASFNANSAIEEVYAENAKNTLTLVKTGGGQGFIKTKPTNVNCGYTCGAAKAEFFAAETAVAVTVTLNKGTTSVTWSGGTGATTCTSNQLTCTVDMSSAQSLTAKFN